MAMQRFLIPVAAAIAALTACGGGGGASSALGGPSPSPTVSPTPLPTGTPASTPTTAPFGAWVLGNNRSGTTTDPTPRLKRFDGSLNVVAEISGSNAHFVNPAGMTTDAAGNIYVLEARYSDATNSIDVFAPSQSGNVAPLASTTFPATENHTILGGRAAGLTLDGAGNAYYIDAEAVQGPTACTIYRVPLTGGASTVTPVGDCDNVIHPDVYHEIAALHYDAARSHLYVSSSARQSNPNLVAVARYDRQTDGTFAVFGRITLVQSALTGDFAIDRAGNILLGVGNAPSAHLDLFAAAAFVAGQNTSPAPIDTYPGDAPVTIDSTGSIFSEAAFDAAGIQVIPGGSHTPSASNGFNALFMAP